MPDLISRWNTEARRLAGRTITGCRYVRHDGLGFTVLRIELDDGTVLAPVADDEANAPGALTVLEGPDPHFHGLPTLP